MPVHALQGADDDAIFGCGYTEGMLAQRQYAVAIAQRARESGLLARLTETPNMNFDQFGQAGHDEVPFIGQAISPAAVRNRRLELLLHHIDNFGRSGVGVEIQIAAEIRPVIERFNHRNRTAISIESRANLVQEANGVLNASALGLEGIGDPVSFGPFAFALENLLELDERADDDMVGHGERSQFFQVAVGIGHGAWALSQRLRAIPVSR